MGMSSGGHEVRMADEPEKAAGGGPGLRARTENHWDGVTEDQMDWHSVQPDGGLLFLKGFVNPRNKEPSGYWAFSPISRRQKCAL